MKPVASMSCIKIATVTLLVAALMATLYLQPVLAGHSPPAWISFSQPTQTAATLAKMTVKWERQPDYQGKPRRYNIDWSKDGGKTWYDGYQGYDYSWVQYGLLIGATYKYRVNSLIAGHWSSYTYATIAVTVGSGWTDNHSGVLPYRPHGSADIYGTFGGPCEPGRLRAVDLTPSRRIWVHYKLEKNMQNVREHIAYAGKTGAVKQAGAYNCRKMAGSSRWSTHAWGIAVDINWSDNPYGQTFWRGDRFLPDVMQNHSWFWGLYFSRTKDPMHFQYATGY